MKDCTRGNVFFLALTIEILAPGKKKKKEPRVRDTYKCTKRRTEIRANSVRTTCKGEPVTTHFLQNFYSTQRPVFTEQK